MSLTRSTFTDPFAEFNTVAQRMLGDPFFRGSQDPFSLMRGNMMMGQEFFQPRVDIWDAGESIRVHADLPGVPKENVKAEILNGQLQIQGETEDINNYENMTSRVRERRYGKFSRIVTLPEGVDESQVKAEFKNGVLELEIPKTKETKAKRIEIS